MRERRLFFCAIAAFFTLLAAVTAIIIFKNEIIDFFTEFRERIEDKRAFRRSEFSDYADL